MRSSNLDNTQVSSLFDKRPTIVSKETYFSSVKRDLQAISKKKKSTSIHTSTRVTENLQNKYSYIYRENLQNKYSYIYRETLHNEYSHISR